MNFTPFSPKHISMLAMSIDCKARRPIENAIVSSLRTLPRLNSYGVGPSKPRPQLEPIESSADGRIHVLKKIIAFGGFRVEGQTQFDCSRQIDAESSYFLTNSGFSKTISPTEHVHDPVHL